MTADVSMTAPSPFESIASLLERSLSIRHVFGDPVQQGDRTIIPVAKVAYGFGGGSGRGRRKGTAPDATDASSTDPEGAGGGGGVRMAPVGYMEITPGGTRFVPFYSLRPLMIAGAIGALAAWLFARQGQA